MPDRHDAQFLDAGCESQESIAGPRYASLYANPGVQVSSRTAHIGEPSCDETSEQGYER